MDDVARFIIVALYSFYRLYNKLFAPLADVRPHIDQYKEMSQEKPAVATDPVAHGVDTRSKPQTPYISQTLRFSLDKNRLLRGCWLI